MTEFGGLERVLDNLEKKIDGVASEVKSIDEKVDMFLLRVVTKDEFNAYHDLRRTTIRWSVATIISVLMLIAAGAGVIIATRPDLVSEGAALTYWL